MSTSLPPLRRSRSPDLDPKAAQQSKQPQQQQQQYSSQQSKSLLTSHDIHLKVVHIANKDFSGYTGSPGDAEATRSESKEAAFETNSNSGHTSGQSSLLLPPIRHQFPMIHASLRRPAKNYRATLDDVPQIRKAIFEFQMNDLERRAQFAKISDIFYDNLSIDGYLANEANARKMNTNSFMTALHVYLPPIKKQKRAQHFFRSQQQLHQQQLSNDSASLRSSEAASEPPAETTRKSRPKEPALERQAKKEKIEAEEEAVIVGKQEQVSESPVSDDKIDKTEPELKKDENNAD